MSLENAGPSRVLVAETLLTFPVVSRRADIESWLNTNYGGVELNGKSVTEIVMSDIDSYSELTRE